MNPQELFQQAFTSYFEKDSKTLTDKQSILAYAEKCEANANAAKKDNPVIASEFHFLTAYSCFCYFYFQERDTDVFFAGEMAIQDACELLEDKEYRILESFYSLISIAVEDSDAFSKLKEINTLCPTFRLLEHNFIKYEFLEDVYNNLFPHVLSRVLDCMLNRKEETSVIEEACILLGQFPSVDHKLKAYTYLSRLYESNGNSDESLRNSKIGIELLGSDLSYDYHSQQHLWWGECWTRIARYYYAKKDYDFAMSLFEKGANLGILECMDYVAIMYEKGEGDDPDPEEAAKYREMAEHTRIERDEERQKIEAERKAREEALLEAQRLAEEEAQRKERERKEAEARAIILAKNRTKKVLYSIISIVSIIVSIWCLSYLSSETIFEKAAQLKKRGNILLLINDQIKDEYFICKDSQSIRIVNNRGETKDLFSFEKKAIITSIKSQSGGGIGVSYSTPDKSPSFAIQSDQKLYFTEIVPHKSYIITNIRLKDYQPNINNHAYLLKLAPSENLLFCFDNWDISFHGEFQFSKWVEGDLAAENPEDFLKTYSRDEYQYFLKKGLTRYTVPVMVKAKDGLLCFSSDVRFKTLDLSFSPDIASPSNNILKQELLAKYNGELTPRRIKNLVFEYVDHHISSDGKSTFVISKDGNNSDKEPYTLYVINNRTEEKRKIRDAIKITFESNSIHVKAYDTFLLFFDSSKDIYYNYSGNKVFEQ